MSDAVTGAWYVYLVQCADESLYTGVTTDPHRRLRQHNGELAGGARYTRARRPVRLLYTEPCRDRSEAGRREAAIKALDRRAKQRLVSGTFNRETHVREPNA